MATLKQMQSRKNTYSIILAAITLTLSYFAYTREDIYILGLLGSLLYGAPALFWVLFVAIKIRWKGRFLPIFKFVLIALLPLALYSRLATSTPNADIGKEYLRIATYNVNRFNNNIDSRFSILEKIDADIISLIEVNSSWEERLKNYSETYPFTYKVKDKRANETVGLSMILSKYPIKQTSSYDEGYISQVDIAVHGKILNIIQVHPLPPLGESLTEKRNDTLSIASKLELGENKIFLGDFNTVNWQEPIKQITLLQGLRVASKGMLTWPSILPIAPIDHILTSFNLTPKGQGKICVQESDHCLIYIDINLQAEPTVKEVNNALYLEK